MPRDGSRTGDAANFGAAAGKRSVQPEGRAVLRAFALDQSEPLDRSLCRGEALDSKPKSTRSGTTKEAGCSRACGSPGPLPRS